MCSSFQLYGFCLCLLSWSWLLISPSPIDKSCHLYSLLALPGSQKPGCSFYVNITVFDPHFVLMQQQQFCFHDFQVFSCGCQVTNFVCHLYIPGHVLSPLGHIFSHLFLQWFPLVIVFLWKVHPFQFEMPEEYLDVKWLYLGLKVWYSFTQGFAHYIIHQLDKFFVLHNLFHHLASHRYSLSGGWVVTLSPGPGNVEL